MELEDLFKDDIDTTDNLPADFITNQTAQVQSMCDCLLTLPIVKLQFLLVSFIKKLKRNISNNNYLYSYSITSDLEKIKQYKLELNNNDFNAIMAEIEEYLEMILLLDNF